MITVTLPIEEFERLRELDRKLRGQEIDLNKRLSSWHNEIGKKLDEKFESQALSVNDRKALKELLDIITDTRP
jgi:hypothetical protein